MLAESGIVRPYSPQVLVGILRAVRTWGTGPAGASPPRGASPHQVGLIDELGSLTFGEMHRRSNALARALAERGSPRATASP